MTNMFNNDEYMRYMIMLSVVYPVHMHSGIARLLLLIGH